MRHAPQLVFLCATLCLSSPLRAQATSNAITTANDAFGFRKGDEAIGIYDEASARGFSLEAAGNYRVHGTYFVKNSGVSSFFLDSISVRIGYNTLPVAFPSPSGIVDYALRDPAKGEPSLLTVGLDPFLQPYTDVLLKHRSEKAGISGAFGVSLVPQMKDAQGGASGGSVLIGGTARHRRGALDLRIFGGEYRYERPSQFRLISDPALLEQRMKRNDFIGVKGLNDRGQRRIAGLLADATLGHGFGVGTTTVFTQEDPSHSFLTLFGGLADDGTVSASVIAAPHQRTTSVSSELRTYWIRTSGADAAHRIDAVGRYRRTRSVFGGATIFQLGRVQFDAPLEHAQSNFRAEGQAELKDHIEQIGAGLAYRNRIGRLRLNGGILRTNYRKDVSGPGIEASKQNTSAWLYNASAAFDLSETLAVYGGYSRGLEEAGIAPASAQNRYEVLAPAQASQVEAAAIVRLSKDLKLVLGAFDLRRGYFGIDGGGMFRNLGKVRHRGIEVSAAGSIARGLTVIMGGVLLDPIVEASSNGIRDRFRPIGVPKLRLLASADYALVSKLHVDASVQYTGSRPALKDAADAVTTVPDSWTVNAGLRSPVKLGRTASTLRLQVLNLLNDFTWEVSSAGTMTFSPSRRFRLALTTEF